MSYALTFTVAGANALAAAVANGTRLVFHRVVLSSQPADAFTPQTASIQSQVWSAAPASVSVQDDLADGTARVLIRAIVPVEAGGWTARSIALFAVDEMLIGYAAFPASYKPLPSTGADAGAGAVWTIDVSLGIGAGQAPAITAPSLADWLEQIISNFGGTGGGTPATFRIFTYPIAVGAESVDVQFSTPFTAGAEPPVVSAIVSKPSPEADDIVANISAVTTDGFTATLSAAPDAAGYNLHVIAVAQP